MFDEKKFLRESLTKKCSDNPKIRNGDPDCWNCLSDEQRDIIHEWYINTQLRELEKSERKDKLQESAGFFALTPIAFAYALLKHPQLGWHFLCEAFSLWLIFAFSYYVAFESYSFFFARDDISKIGKIILNIIAVFISFFVIFTVLSLAKII